MRVRNHEFFILGYRPGIITSVGKSYRFFKHLLINRSIAYSFDSHTFWYQSHRHVEGRIPIGGTHGGVDIKGDVALHSELKLPVAATEPNNGPPTAIASVSGTRIRRRRGIRCYDLNTFQAVAIGIQNNALHAPDAPLCGSRLHQHGHRQNGNQNKKNSLMDASKRRCRSHRDSP